MSEVIAEKNGYKLTIAQDEYAENPRKDFDHAGILLALHRDYDLSDRKTDRDEILGILRSDRFYSLPVYAYEHGGITLSTSNSHYPFNDMWDSGMVGVIYMPEETAWREFPSERTLAGLYEKVTRLLKAEIAEFDQYLTGDVWNYCIEDSDGNIIDSCCGFYGYSYCKREALEAFSAIADRQQELSL